MTTWADDMSGRLAVAFDEAADPERAAGQQAYLRDQFPFFGIGAQDLKTIQRDALADLPKPELGDLDRFARLAYAEPEREWHYVAVKTLRRHNRLLDPSAWPLVRHLVETHSWWDTVDEIASHLAGAIVERHPDAVTTMDSWVMDDHLWIARTAILHQLRFKDTTDVDRLFRYCLARADEPDFFYRKAIGWALRQYARTDPDAVARFCDDHEAELSPLSLREARKHL